MPRNEISYKIVDLKRLQKAFGNPAAFNAALRKRMRLATGLNGKLAERAQRQAIKANVPPNNAVLTIAIKSSSKTLVDSGDLFQGISSTVVDDFTVFTGVTRRENRYDIAVAVHEGVSIPVTPAMRGMFFYLWQVSSGEMDPSKLTGRALELYRRKPSGWYPLSPSTVEIRIPSRPWTVIAFSSSEFKAKVVANWTAALARAFNDMAAK